MDPLFERRELTKKVHIFSKYLQRNIEASILAQLKMDYEGRCSSEGFIQRNSITIVKYSLGKSNYTKGGVDYEVSFQADVCFPHVGQIFEVPVSTRSKIGIHAETPPIKVLIPRDLHIGNEEFENVKENDQIKFEVIGTNFKQQDRDIIVLGKLLSKETLKEEVIAEAPELVVTATPDENVRVVATEEAPKKRKLKQSAPPSSNELVPEVKKGDS
jgi:DNA-directed RNA polymerase subunit E'/Rpb7